MIPKTISVYCSHIILLLLLAASLSHATPEPAQPADDFVDRIGVATHWGYPDTPYGYAYDQVKKLLGEAGIRHVRDGFHPREVDLFDTYGIKTTVILGPGKITPAEQVQQIAPYARIFDMVEGPNEVDIFPTSSNYAGKSFPEGPIAYQNDLYAAVRANPATAQLGVIAPSTARRGSNLKLAPLNSFDFVVMHSYAGGGPPAGSLEGDFSNILEAGRIQGHGAALKPIMVTESGYHTALGNNVTLGGAQPGVSEAAHAKYIPRHFAEYFNAGIVRTFIYEFADEFTNEENNAEASFGLVRHDLTPKPAYFSLKNLVSLLKEARWNAAEKQWEKPAFSPRALDFDLQGDTRNIHHTLLQKSNGDFYLLLWQEIPSFDTRTKKDIENPSAPVILKLNSPVRQASAYLVGKGMEAIQDWNNPQSLQLNVPDEILVVRLAPVPPARTRVPKAPSRIQAAAAGSSITLSWPAVRGAKGYFVWRLGRFQQQVSQPSFTQDHLLPGTGYTYTIQSYDRAGNISSPVTQVVRTRAEYPDLVINDLSWTPANPKTGDPVSFSATIKNIGNGPTPAGITIGVAFYVDNTFVNWSDTSHESLAPGESRIVTANNGPRGARTWTATAGQHTITVQVDDVDRINESNENNNKLTQPLTVSGSQ